MSPIDYLVHVSNVMLLISYSVRNILWLRWFAVASAVIEIPYYLGQTNVLWPPVAWGVVFIFINLYQIAHIYWRRRSIVLSAEEQSLYNMGFQTIRRRDFVSLIVAGQWKEAAAGDRILTQDAPLKEIYISIEGTVDARCGGRTIGQFRPGQVIGLALAFTGDPSPIEAAFAERGRYIVWEVGEIRKFLEKRPELRGALNDLVNRELSQRAERAAK